MLKNILGLLAASTSFAALLLITNSAIAIYPTTNLVDRADSSIVSLNVVSPSWQSAKNTNSLLNHLGCSCASCIQSTQAAVEI